eukprot:TRINITY_DN105443_c0_g1_i1.p1 TRINITY_DN105443_c0_g1~~TRINITY_DN105443_c0_g1_i1.p1  ORF type:complete len:232 (-),score=54.33 TRINITY_DN105443_c0_g1_i1:581-1276(-)
MVRSNGYALLLPSQAVDHRPTRFQDQEARTSPAAQVTLHVYSVSTASSVERVNQVLGKVCKTGAFHAAVEVYSKEWSFGATEKGTGVFCCNPKECEAHKYLHSLPMGSTALSRSQVLASIGRLAKEWQGEDYDLLRCNCCHFADALLAELDLGPLPRQFLSLAGAGAAIADRALLAKAIGLAVAQAAANVVSRVAAAKPAIPDKEEDSTKGNASAWSCQGVSSRSRYQRCN